MGNRDAAGETDEALQRRIKAAAARALAEAQARREQAAVASEARPEVDGRGGNDPVRYGDWEVKGIATDF